MAWQRSNLIIRKLSVSRMRNRALLCWVEEQADGQVASNQWVPPESGDVCAVLAIEDLSQVPFPINKCHQRVVTRNSSANTRTTWILFPINRCHQRVVTHHLRDVAIAFRVEFPIKWCHQRVVTLADSAPDEPDESIEFPIKWCHQRVVTTG